jgi:hypothetical protein
VIYTWHEPTWAGIASTLRRILECKRIVSQSFHGVVIAEAYGIPVLNFRQMPGAGSEEMRVDLREPCETDPRVFEFYQGGPRPHYPMFAQRRDERSDWERIARAVDRAWEPFAFDPGPLVEAFPLPLAYDPVAGKLPAEHHLDQIRF